MAVKVGINGFGRIGRLVFRAAQADGDVNVVAVNDLSDSRTLGHLLKYDSTHGKYPGEVTWKEKSLVVDGNEVSVLGERDPSLLPWGAMAVDIVIESVLIYVMCPA